jgi:hypothetical protein
MDFAPGCRDGGAKRRKELLAIAQEIDLIAFVPLQAQCFTRH